MSATPNRFVRRTTLHADEYRKNFRQIDRDAIEMVKSAAAKQVTHSMGTLYLTLIDAPAEYWEREGVLRFAGGAGEGGSQTAWQQLIALLDCGNTTAKKALDWMHEQGVIGYYAGKNGVGIRIFINRAVTSIGRREGQKNLRLVRTPTSAAHTPAVGMPFKDSFADPETSDLDIDPRAPKSGADTGTVSQADSTPELPQLISCMTARRNERYAAACTPSVSGAPVNEIIDRLKHELEPCVRDAAAQAAGQIAAREVERTRQWFETKALPKAVRVAQRETYNLLRKNGIGNRGRGRADLTVGLASSEDTTCAARPLTTEEVHELAEACVALLEVQGKAIEATLAELCSAEGGWLLPQDVVRVREEAQALMLTLHERGNNC
jgi:hypothetical protein